MVIEDPQGTRVALVACDVLMLNRDILDQAARRIEQETGIPLISPDQCDTYPQRPTTVTVHGYKREEAFTRQVGDKIVEATIAATKRLGPATMNFRLGEESSVGRNSRLLLATARFSGLARAMTSFDPPVRSTRSCPSGHFAGQAARWRP